MRQSRRPHRPPAEAGGGSGGSGESTTRGGVCPTVSDSGTCCRTGWLCRTGDRGARTAAASGAPATRVHRSDTRRWTRS
ncbi:hypothetical protein GCM10009549_17490 [Streptomyces thermoalcalitolerans]|uniref:Uncharacterized protein n=1 Tax=Streptomyces thermoalcalitolerans TaxID=65605 RepID=A0ABN1NIH0_9ACTN